MTSKGISSSSPLSKLQAHSLTINCHWAFHKFICASILKLKLTSLSPDLPPFHILAISPLYHCIDSLPLLNTLLWKKCYISYLFNCTVLLITLWEKFTMASRFLPSIVTSKSLPDISSVLLFLPVHRAILKLLTRLIHGQQQVRMDVIAHPLVTWGYGLEEALGEGRGTRKQAVT